MTMTKPLKFYQTLNQAPRSAKHGQHRRARPASHDYPAGEPGDGTRGTDQSGPAWTTISLAGVTSITVNHTIFAESKPKPKPPTLPYAGIRTGELIGHRLWWLIDGCLCSLAHRRLWQPGETIHGDTKEVVWNDPFWNETIWGGVYAFLEGELLVAEIRNIAGLVEEVRQMRRRWGFWHPMNWNGLAETETFVSGTIKMWGDVFEHQRGYRAEFAKLNSIDEIFGLGDIDALREKYGVASSNGD